MFYTVALQNARDECLQADAHSKSVGTIEATNKNPRIKRLLWYMLIIPVVFSVFLWLLGTYATREYVPNSLDVHVWRNFSTHVKQACKQSILITLTTFCLCCCVYMLCKFFSASLSSTLARLCTGIFSVFYGGGLCVVFGSFFWCVFLL